MAENSIIFAKGGGLALRSLLSEYDQCALHLWAEKLVEEATLPLRAEIVCLREATSLYKALLENRSVSSPTPETGPPLSDALPECQFRWCPTLDKCKTGGCATPWAKGPVSAPGEPDET